MKSFKEYINYEDNVKKMNDYINKNMQRGKSVHESIRAYYEHLLKLPSKFAEIFVPNFKDFEKLIIKGGYLPKNVNKQAKKENQGQNE